MDEAQYTRVIESLWHKQHSLLTRRGIPDVEASLAIHGAVLVLSSPGLRAEAAESNLPLEVIEYRAVRDAARDVAKNYGLDERQAVKVISTIVSKYAN